MTITLHNKTYDVITVYESGLAVKEPRVWQEQTPIKHSFRDMDSAIKTLKDKGYKIIQIIY